MEGIRHRKQSGSDSGKDSMGNQLSGGLHTSYRFIRKVFYFLGFCCLAFVILVILHNSWPFKSKRYSTNTLDRVSVALGVQEKVHAVVFDAGSTGSRVSAFTFFRSADKARWKRRRSFPTVGPMSGNLNNTYDNSLKLHDQLWHEVKPGLSSYADDPVKGAESITGLIEMAKERIPKENWAQTPVVLKATAGLRLLPEEKANALLEEVRKVLEKSGFKTTENSVGIMDGKDEGIFSWFTVNYLLDHLTGEMSDTLVALDLGGGSTQITFVPALAETLNSVSKDSLLSVTLLQKNVNLFTHSYLGLGLMAARENVFKAQGIEEGNEVFSSCINPVIQTDWEYAGITYKIRGPKNPNYDIIPGQAGRLTEKRPIADYEACLSTCIDVIKEKVENIPAELKSREVIAFSYFFDRAMERGLIDPFSGGIVTTEEFSKAAKQACEIPNTEQPFACLDLTIISALLRNGYNLKSDSPVKLYKRIDGYEVSWGIGLAFHIINNGI